MPPPPRTHFYLPRKKWELKKRIRLIIADLLDQRGNGNKNRGQRTIKIFHIGVHGPQVTEDWGSPEHWLFGIIKMRINGISFLLKNLGTGQNKAKETRRK